MAEYNGDGCFHEPVPELALPAALFGCDCKGSGSESAVPYILVVLG